jgi:hypothetical protein
MESATAAALLTEPPGGSPRPQRGRLWLGLVLAAFVLGASILVTAGVTLAEASGASRAPAASAASWLFFAGLTVLMCAQAMLSGSRSGLICLRGCFAILLAVSPLVWHSDGMRAFALSTSGLWLLLSCLAKPQRAPKQPLAPRQEQGSVSEGSVSEGSVSEGSVPAAEEQRAA